MDFPEGSFKLLLALSFLFFLDLWVYVTKKRKIEYAKVFLKGCAVKLPPEKRQYLEIGQH